METELSLASASHPQACLPRLRRPGDSMIILGGLDEARRRARHEGTSVHGVAGCRSDEHGAGVRRRAQDADELGQDQPGGSPARRRLRPQRGEGQQRPHHVRPERTGDGAAVRAAAARRRRRLPGPVHAWDLSLRHDRVEHGPGRGSRDDRGAARVGIVRGARQGLPEDRPQGARGAAVGQDRLCLRPEGAGQFRRRPERAQDSRHAGLSSPHPDARRRAGRSPHPGGLYTALEKGVIDGAASPVVGLLGVRWHEVAKYVTQPSFGFTHQLILMHGEAWNRLSDADKKILLEAGRQMEDVWYQEYDRMAAEEIKELTSRGATVTALGPSHAKLNEVWGEGLWELAEKKSPNEARELRQIAKSKGLTD